MTLNQTCVDELKKWFTDHVRTYKSSDPEIDKNFKLKEAHSRRVCKEILYIGSHLGLNDEQLRLAEIIALFHDIGRFEQYARYRTFVDRTSENHAELGISILQKHAVLDAFADDHREVIVRAIRYHNRAVLPSDDTQNHLFFAKLIRDADKLDIWKVTVDYYYRKDGETNDAIELDLPDEPFISEEIYRALIQKKIVDTRYMKTRNDFKLLQVGWVFDVNFQPTLNRIKERRYLELIRDVLPQSRQIDAIFDVVSKEM